MLLHALDIPAGATGAERSPLVILHGLLGSSRNWGGIARTLAGEGRVVALDLPNHGASPWSEAMDYPFLAEAVAESIAALAPSAMVLGHSMGGKAAMLLALSRPMLVERLVVVDIAPVAYTHTFAPYVKAMRAVSLAGAASRAAVEAGLSEVIPDPRVRAFLLRNLDGRPGSYRWRPNLAALAAAMDDILGFPAVAAPTPYAGPALFLAGAESDYVQPQHEPLIRRLFPQAEIHRLAGAGHWVHADQPQAFIAAVAAFRRR
ncbi:MAG: alpha/beta fold hydrolase [Magnetospirillum sp.]|nr:alpha/beta fold hydrolase [Magnetospirillum sp.]